MLKWKKYYNLRSMEEVAERDGLPVEDMEDVSYDLECHKGWLEAKPEYYDALADNGLENLELIEEDGEEKIMMSLGFEFEEVSEDIIECLKENNLYKG